ncbi:MAG: M67 family metallopeptidase [Candidatus Latescibacteria bacterium]|jgi:adenylyltransferase/sulfurtransferase|nr:M67 family metallopeptidase [Candidatus Latescibacterota bacterium]
MEPVVNLELSGEPHNIIAAHSVSEYPNECCGVITLREGEITVHQCRNILDDLHAQDPEGYPRDSANGYYIDPDQLRAILEQTEKDSGEVVGFYHSHPDVGAYFSDEDHERAMFFDEPIYPRAVHVVVSVKKGQAKEVKKFVWNVETRSFDEITAG